MLIHLIVFYLLNNSIDLEKRLTYFEQVTNSNTNIFIANIQYLHKLRSKDIDITKKYLNNQNKYIKNQAQLLLYHQIQIEQLMRDNPYNIRRKNVIPRVKL